MAQGEVNWKPMAPKAIKVFIYIITKTKYRKLEIERRIYFLESKGRVLWLFTV